jgi:hypothetical protein
MGKVPRTSDLIVKGSEWALGVDRAGIFTKILVNLEMEIKVDNFL